MKKAISLTLALVMCLALIPMIPTPASAAEAFPEKIDPPESVILSEDYSGRPDIANYRRIRVTFNKSAAIAELYNAGLSSAGRERYGLNYLSIYIQVDWSIDSQNDWKYHPNWDQAKDRDGRDYGLEGEDNRHQLYSESTTETLDILYTGDYSINRYPEKWEEWLRFLKPGQYKIVKDDWDDDYGIIDYTEHTVYVRTRFIATYRPDGSDMQYVFSDWSPVVGYGKDYKPFERPESLEAPVISDLKLADYTFNDGPVVEFNLNNPRSIKENTAGAKSLGEDIYLHAEVSIGGGDWVEVALANRDITDGKVYAHLVTAAKTVTEDTHVRLRVQYGYHSSNGRLILSSPWSNIAEFGAPAWGNASGWAEPELKKAEELGLIPEVLRGTDLTKAITRAEFAAVSVRVYEVLANTTALPVINNPFTDTKDVEVLKAYNAGITAGTAKDKFSPDVLLNREQAAAMLTRVFKRVTLAGWTLATDSQFTLTYTKPALFADDAQISDWAKDSVYFMVANEIIRGVGDNKFAPRATTSDEEARGYAQATREQALLIAVRMVENLK